MSLLGAMCAGADSIDDADRLRHGAMARAFAGIRAPSTLGTFLRSFTHGHNLQLHRVHRQFLAALARRTPLLPGAGEVMFIDVDPTHRRVYGRAKQGAEHGRLNGQRTLHPIVATLSTPLARPVIATAALRKMRHQPFWRLSQQTPTGMETCRILGWSCSQVRVDRLLCEDRLSVTT
jgi:hypothetical protein